jgi:HTH-type transcriptional regulator / antitoxin HigA
MRNIRNSVKTKSSILLALIKNKEMERLQYKIIKNVSQYKSYCRELEELVTDKKRYKANEDTIDLLTLLIETWDKEHNTFADADPVGLLAYIMNEHKLKAVNLAAELKVSKSLISDILNYRRGFSKEIIRKLAERFKLNQEAFNRPYKLISPKKPQVKDSRGINSRKKLSSVI